MNNTSLLLSKPRSGRGLLRTVSAFLVFLFLMQEFALANPDLLKITVQGGAEDKASKAWARELLPAIPESVAAIEDAYRAPDSNKTLILIQDAHTNNSCQINTSKALDLILEKDKGISLIFSEAAVGDNSLSFLRKYASIETRKRIAKSYLNKGLLHGVEYLDLTSDHHFTIWGVENPELYFQSVDTYRTVAKNREKFQAYLDKVELALKTLKPKTFNPFLLSFDEKFQKYKKQEISLTDYFDILTRQAKQLDLPLKDYPHLEALKDIRKLESQIDFKKTNQEQQQAVPKLSNEDQSAIKASADPSSGGNELLAAQTEDRSPFKLSSEENRTKKAFFALLEEKLVKEPFRYPELMKYFNYLKQAKNIQAKQVLKEQKRLEDEIFRKLCTNEDEINLLKASKNVDLLKKLLNLTLTPEDFDEYQKDRKNFDITIITGFLNRKIMDLKKDYERAVFLETGYEDIIKKCEEFYALTRHRDMEFIKNLTEKMDKEGQQETVLITGGYHSPNLKYLLKEKGISYICLTPQVLQETNIGRYESLLLSQYNVSKNQFPSAVPAIAMFNMTGFAMGHEIPPPNGARLVVKDIAGENPELMKTLVSVGARIADTSRARSGARTAKTEQPAVQEGRPASIDQSVPFDDKDIPYLVHDLKGVLQGFFLVQSAGGFFGQGSDRLKYFSAQFNLCYTGVRKMGGTSTTREKFIGYCKNLLAILDEDTVTEAIALVEQHAELSGMKPFRKEGLLKQLAALKFVRWFMGGILGIESPPKWIDFEELLDLCLYTRQKFKEVAVVTYLAKTRTLFADDVALCRVIINLIRNAYDAIPEVTGKIIIRVVDAGEDRITIEVEDNGAGISRQNLPRIFKPGFTTKALGKGSGLGLAIVENLVKNRLNGSIAVESEEGHGSVFRVTIPIRGARMASAPAGLDDNFVIGIHPAPGQSIAVSLKPEEPSILTFMTGPFANLIDVYVGGEYFKTVNAAKIIRDEVARISVADMIGVLREFNRKYNQQLAPELQSVPIETYVHLNSFEGLPDDLQESMITSELASIASARLANYKAIHIVGDDDLVKKAYAIIDRVRGLKSKRGLFVSGDATRYPEANQVHILTKNHFLANPDLKKDPKRRFVTLDDIHYDPASRTVDVVAFNPVVFFMEMVGAMDNLSKDGNTFTLAYEYFKKITGYDITRDEFLGLLQGDPQLVRRFSLPPAIRAVDINLAMRVEAIDARMAAQAA